MLIKSEIDVAKSPDQVWAFFNDIPLVASCLPGADISEKVRPPSQIVMTLVDGSSWTPPERTSRVVAKQRSRSWL
jgi:carbon monoxide dehydrogenase subunit G